MRSDPARGVDQHVSKSSLTAGNERLVKFVEGGVAEDDQNRDQSPTQVPAFFASADSAENQQAENEIFGEVGAFTNDVVKQFERLVRSAGQQPMQEGNEVMAGVLGGKSASRKAGNGNGPEQSRPPSFEPSHQRPTLRAGRAAASRIRVSNTIRAGSWELRG